MSHKRELKRGYKKKGYFIITKRSTYQEDMTLVNINAPNVGAPEYRKQILRNIKGGIDLFNLDFLFLVIEVFFFFKILFILERGGKGGRKRGRETSVCCCFSRGPHWGPDLQPRHVP